MSCDLIMCNGVQFGSMSALSAIQRPVWVPIQWAQLEKTAGERPVQHFRPPSASDSATWASD